MGLIYNVAIIDDQSVMYEEYKDVIDDYLFENGFTADIDFVASSEEFEKYSLDKPDLFLVDLKFGHEDKGQNFIKSIRDNNLTDVLFYSSDHDAIERYRKDFGSQGIFFAEREEQNDEVIPLLKKLLTKIIAKCNTPRTTRGIVMECVAEIDDRIKEKTLVLYDRITDDDRKNYLDKVVKEIKKSNDGKMKKYQDFFGTPFVEILDAVGDYKIFDMQDLVEDYNITDSNRNLNHFRTLYKKIYGKDEVYSGMSEYEGLLTKRNTLAHVSQKKDGDYFVFASRKKGGEDLKLTEEVCLKLRKSVLKINELLDRIE